MEKIITIKNEYNSLDNLFQFLKQQTNYQCQQEYDKWEVRTDAQGQMEKCIMIKKSGTQGIKLFFNGQDTVKVNHIIPNPVMNAYFGKSQKRYRNVIEIATEKIKNSLLATGQKKAFDELSQIVEKASV